MDPTIGKPSIINVHRENTLMAKGSKIYEAVYIVNASLDDTQIENAITRTSEFIGKQGGTVRTLDRWGRKRFAYSIQKKNNGFFVLCEFDAPGDLIAKLGRYFALEEQIIRHLIVEVDAKILKARAQQAAAAESAEAAATGTTGSGPTA